MAKKICSRIHFSAIAHLQGPPINVSLENEPDSQSSFYRQTYYNLFKQNALSAHIRKNTHY